MRLLIRSNIWRSLTAIHDKSLNTPLNDLIKGNILIIDTLVLYKTIAFIKSPIPGHYIANFSLAGRNGKKIITFDNLDIEKRADEQLKNVLISYRGELLARGSKYKENIKHVSNNGMWIYLTLLPYAINVYDTGNIVPESKIANLIYFIHKYFMNIVLFGLFIPAVYDYIKELGKKSKSEIL